MAAAADEVTIAHPHQDATVASTALILGGPVLFLIGITLFKWTLWGYVPRTRLIAIGALASLVPLAIVTTVLALSLAATSILVALVMSDLRAERTKLAAAGRSKPETNDQDFSQSTGYAERIPLIEEN